MKKLLYTLFLAIFATTTFAANCPDTKDFVRQDGIIYGYYWGLTDTAKADWSLTLGARFMYEGYEVMPGDTRLNVRIKQDGYNIVTCDYTLPDGTEITATSNANRRISISTLHIPPFIKRTGYFIPHSLPGDPPQLPVQVDAYVCDTTAANASMCYFDWLK